MSVGMAISAAPKACCAPAERFFDRSRKRLDAAGGIGGDGAQQFAELMRRAGIETAIGAARKPRDLTIGVLRHRIVALLEHEHRHAEQPQFAGRLARASIGSSIASPTKTSACTFCRACSWRAWLRTLPIWVWPPRQSMRDIKPASCSLSATHPTRGIRSGRGNRRAECRGRRSRPPRGTCRPAARRRCPRSAGGSWWRRARRSAGRACAGLRRRAKSAYLLEKGVDLRSGRNRRPDFAGSLFSHIENSTLKKWNSRGPPSPRQMATLTRGFKLVGL